jgi:hypothetical protein
MSYEYLLRFLRLTAQLLEQLLGRTKLNIADSKEITTKRYKDTKILLKPTRKLITYKTHCLITYYPKEHLTVIKYGIGSNHHISDSEGVVRMINCLEKDDLLFADRGFDYEKVYRKCKELGIKSY